MKLTAVYKNENNQFRISRDDYFASKSDFAAELKANGFRSIRVFTDTDIKRIKAKKPYDPMTATEEYIYQH